LTNPAAQLTRPFEPDAQTAASSVGGAPPSAHAAAEIVAITTQDDFLLELGAVVGEQAAVHPVESVAMALEHMGSARRAQILAIDTRDIADLRDAVGRAYARAADVAILLFANAADEESVRHAFRASKIVAVLPIPIDPPRTALAFAGALADAVAQFSAPPPLSVALSELSTAPPPTAIAAVSRTRLNPPREYRWALGVGVAILVLAAAPWFLRRSPEHASPAPKAQISVPAVQVPLAQGRVDELLEKARTAMAERRYTEPAEDSALLYYRSAQAADSGSAEARDGLARVAAVLVSRFEEDLRQSQFDAAAATLASFRSAAPQDSRGSAFESRLAGAKAHAESARREEQARLKRLADEAAQSARDQEAQRKARERAAALAAAAKAAQEQAEAASARQAAEAAAAEAASAAQKSAAARPAVTPAQLKLTHYVPPDYPPAALARNVSGNVTLTYTVDVKGVTRDVRVLIADPAGIFERNAVEAVKQWRYAPVKIDNAPVAVPTRTVIQFKPQ